MSRKGLIAHSWRHDSTGKLVEVLYHTPEERERFLRGLPPAGPGELAPALEPIEPEPRRRVARGVQGALL